MSNTSPTSSPEPSISGLTLVNNPTTAETSPTTTTYTFPAYTTFPPFYTLQPNLTTRARQLELWSNCITTYCAHHHIFQLSLSTPPADLFHNARLKRTLKSADVRTVLDFMSQPSNGPRFEWIPSTSRSTLSNTGWVYWKTPGEWADAIAGWIDATGQKGAVLTIYELREGEAVVNQEWREIDEVLLRKVLAVLIKRGKAQIFGQEDNAGVKFF